MNDEHVCMEAVYKAEVETLRPILAEQAQKIRQLDKEIGKLRKGSNHSKAAGSSPWGLGRQSVR
jgi:hypothetical protein